VFQNGTLGGHLRSTLGDVDANRRRAAPAVDNDGTTRIYDWDLQGGPCGASVDHGRAADALTEALRAAPVGAQGCLRECALSPFGGMQPVRVLAHATHRATGVVWRYEGPS
jgi:hypothetical protein